MSLFDTSSIFEAIMNQRVEILLGTTTIPLALYELGNIIWKKTSLLDELTLEEAVELMKVVDDVLKRMVIYENNGLNPKSLIIAQQGKMSYYDSSFVHSAIELGYQLVTEDNQMRKISQELGVPVVSIKDV
jgi:predicted nucleic acid-binding protein